jgi:hypothetical protein
LLSPAFEEQIEYIYSLKEFTPMFKAQNTSETIKISLERTNMSINERLRAGFAYHLMNICH